MKPTLILVTTALVLRPSRRRHLQSLAVDDGRYGVLNLFGDVASQG